MKIEDVIKAIETTVEVAEDSLTCHGYNEATEQLIDMHKITLEALKKQIAKKPIERSTFQHIGRCADCKHLISTRSASNNCQYCGQKIDWSEPND